MRVSVYRLLNIIAAAFLLCLVQPSYSQSGFYRYVDQNGRVRYTDNSANIPPEQMQSMRAGAAAHDPEATIPQDRDEPDGGRVVVNYDARGGTIFVNAVLDRHYPVVFQVDTGASSSMITASDARNLNIAYEPGRRVRGLIADGSIVEMSVVRLGSIGVGEAVVEDIEVTVGKLRLLGMDFLENFELTINSQAGQLVLIAKDSALRYAADDPQPESSAARQDREQAKRDIDSRIQQLSLVIKTRHSTIERYQADIHDAELKRTDAESSLENTRDQTRFEGSGVSRNRGKESAIGRLEKNIQEIDLYIQNRQDTIRIQQEQIEEMKNRIRYLRTLRARIE